jgi:hypothetical protein
MAREPITVEWPQDIIDASMLDDEHDVAGDDEWEMSCGLMRGGMCSQAGTEHCDFECPNRHSELFVGSAAWLRRYDQAGGQ